MQNCVNFQHKADWFQTSTGKGHRFIPTVPQEFDCRIKLNVKKESLYKDLTIKDEQFKTIYVGDYPRKVILSDQLYRAPPNNSMEYVRTIQEKLASKPPPVREYPLSETKDLYRIKYKKSETKDIDAPCNSAKCYIEKLGTEQQPAILPNQKGFWKWTDPYLTSYKSEFLPFDEDNKIANKTLTFYNESDFELPPASGNKTMFDKSVFNNVLPGRLLSRAEKRVPNLGMQSEYQDHYEKQTFSYLYPYLQDRCTKFEDPLAPSSRWQSLAPPGMYCSEYCNLAGLSVRRVVAPSAPKKNITRTEVCCRI